MENFENEYLQTVYKNTRVLRTPFTGIVKGYHRLPYIIVSPHKEKTGYSVELEGLINVSPKLIISRENFGETFGDIFGEENIDKEIIGRTFSFQYAASKNYNIISEDLKMEEKEMNYKDLMDKVQDRLSREEDIRKGLIYSPDVRFYPVSIDKFISGILSREF
ncbi:MAG: hypothetical protein ACLFQK_02640 [Fibrobacterota bacterium]